MILSCTKSVKFIVKNVVIYKYICFKQNYTNIEQYKSV